GRRLRRLLRLRDGRPAPKRRGDPPAARGRGAALGLRMLVARRSPASRPHGGRPRAAGDVEASPSWTATRCEAERGLQEPPGADLGGNDLLRLRLAAAGIHSLLVRHALTLTEGIERVAFHLRPVKEDV